MALFPNYTYASTGTIEFMEIEGLLLKRNLVYDINTLEQYPYPTGMDGASFYYLNTYYNTGMNNQSQDYSGGSAFNMYMIGETPTATKNNIVDNIDSDKVWIFANNGSNTSSFGYFKLSTKTFTKVGSNPTFTNGILTEKNVIIVGQDNTNIFIVYNAYTTATVAYMASINKSTGAITTNSVLAGSTSTVYNEMRVIKRDYDNKFAIIRYQYAGFKTNIIKISWSTGTLTSSTLTSQATASTAVSAKSTPLIDRSGDKFWDFRGNASLTTFGLFLYTTADNYTTLSSTATTGTVCTIDWSIFTAPTYVTQKFYQLFLTSNGHFLLTQAHMGSITGSTLYKYWVLSKTNDTTFTCINSGDLIDSAYGPWGTSPDGRFIISAANAVNIIFYTFNTTTNSLEKNTTIQTANAVYANGFDSMGRFWYRDSATTPYGNYYFLDSTTSQNITISLQNQNQTYTGSNLSNNVIVNAYDFASARLAKNITLYVAGNAIFTSNGLKTINVTTSSSADLLVPLTITGAGAINLSGKLT